jgi:hypothetical protein
MCTLETRQPIEMVDRRTAQAFPLVHHLSDRQIDMILAGSLLPWVGR